MPDIDQSFLQTTYKFLHKQRPLSRLLSKLRSLNCRSGILRVGFYVDRRTLSLIPHDHDDLDPVCNNWLLGWDVRLATGVSCIVRNPEYFGPGAASPEAQFDDLRVATNIGTEATGWDLVNESVIQELVRHTKLHDITNLNRCNLNERQTRHPKYKKRVMEYRFSDGCRRVKRPGDTERTVVLIRRRRQRVRN